MTEKKNTDSNYCRKCGIVMPKDAFADLSEKPASEFIPLQCPDCARKEFPNYE